MRMRDARAGRFAALVVPIALLTAAGAPGCGYSLAGRGTFLPSYIQTIGIPLFTNATTFFQVEQILTDKVRTEFIGRGKYKVVPDPLGVDAVVSGDITSISVTPASFTGQQQASRYVFVLVAKISFRDVKTNKILWENPSLVFREEYEVASAFDPNLFFGQESNALERIASDFAKTVVSAILEAF